MIRVHTHVGASPDQGTLPRAKKVSTGHFFALPQGKAALFESQLAPKKDQPIRAGLFWCERWDSNPHGITTRTSNVLVYHSNTLAWT